MAGFESLTMASPLRWRRVQLDATPPTCAAERGRHRLFDHLDIANAIAWGDGDFGALMCHPSDLRGLLIGWDCPAVWVSGSYPESAALPRPPTILDEVNFHGRVPFAGATGIRCAATVAPLVVDGVVVPACQRWERLMTGSVSGILSS